MNPEDVNRMMDYLHLEHAKCNVHSDYDEQNI
jgi:hypothetical protein